MGCWLYLVFVVPQPAIVLVVINAVAAPALRPHARVRGPVAAAAAPADTLVAGPLAEAAQLLVVVLLLGEAGRPHCCRCRRACAVARRGRPPGPGPGPQGVHLLLQCLHLWVPATVEQNGPAKEEVAVDWGVKGTEEGRLPGLGWGAEG